MLQFQFKPIKPIQPTPVKLNTMSFMSKGVKSCSSCR